MISCLVCNSMQSHTEELCELLLILLSNKYVLYACFWKWMLKRIKYEIRLGEPNRPMSMSPKKVEPILCVGPLTERRPRLAHQVSDSWRLALQGEDLPYKDETCSARRRLALQGWDLLYKERRQDLTTIKSPNILLIKVRVTDSSLAL